jgi:UDP-GlcNAc:undecaprenyl-phosphate GlcNAc-1-phosphate transferase
VIDRPTESRKVHRLPIAYLGGVAVFLGLMAGILYSYMATVSPKLMEFHPTRYLDSGGEHFAVPISVIFGMTLIMLVGLIDDVAGISPRLKIGGQLVAAAALAANDVGVKVAAGLIIPIVKALGVHTTLVNDLETVLFQIPLPALIGSGHVTIDVVYWVGTAIIAIFVLGACNASNLIDGLDGLLSGVTGIAAFGLCVIALGMAVADDGPRDAPRIVLCMALLGACLGFLPHNFNPATIFLGDAGSLLLGFCSIVIILMLGDTGRPSWSLPG